MALTADQITAQNFKDFYEQIRPYLNGQVPTFANQFSRSDLYSTSEKIIGQWIDGKPLYQKTVLISNVSIPSAGQADNIVLLSENDVNLVDSYGCLYRSTAVEVLPITSINNSDGCVYWTARIRQNKTNNVITLQIINYNLDARTYDLFATLRYTKTTDSAIKVGTGTDYSTEEQVVGTWIDGKPLYQKTVDTGALPNAATKNIQHNISNIDKVINIFGFSLSGTSTMPLPYTASNSDSNLSVQVTSSLVNISITCGTNRSNQTVSYVTLQYTKTTD